MKSIYIYGASGHGLVVADIAKANGYDDIRFIDDGENVHPTFEEIKNDTHIPIAFGVGNNHVRARLFEKIVQNGLSVITLIHPSAVVSDSVSIGRGSVVMPNVTVNANASIGEGVILNSGSVIEHECSIENFVHISPHAALAGNVKIGAFTHIGIGSTIIQNIAIGAHSIIGAGSVVLHHISDHAKAYGVPCKEIKES
ncbi:sugar O-acyltransferase, sialic acid O-acetyltransferase NeuD family [Sulfuricurvum kujiense DSM 16994]|uniref:Sugar O-acyltransferase, sialic acid O-acetyltransferase NeuD family n=1 Tax=Sulfuricurvum kujiense (strain ATCC BAA-921 / DSM 16994 / JCM 11577 / YK-1) TaxID=709032 RepID=E4TYC6_SULKY|nr:UDP-N-acetylbacillosamine N-acetyltransferase [Sulfuricurvum kujiense]ADR35071.1 sugar O-acyltransferase, sialic acid O-acetyltransferase NeuD family [Sulfuricurvum kujiense DSM 16994]